MTENLFNSEAFEQMPGQMSMADVAENPRTWDGEPMYSADTVQEAASYVSMMGTEYAGYDVVDRMSGKIMSGPYPRYVDAFNAARETGRLAGVRER